MSNFEGAYKLFRALVSKGSNLPPDSALWSEARKSGWTLAHTAASEDLLPPGFTGWGISAPRDGWSVAHEYALSHVLPADFPGWGARDLEGHSVAWVALFCATLPEGIDAADLVSDGGDVLAFAAEYNVRLPVSLLWAIHKQTHGEVKGIHLF